MLAHRVGVDVVVFDVWVSGPDLGHYVLPHGAGMNQNILLVTQSEPLGAQQSHSEGKVYYSSSGGDRGKRMLDRECTWGARLPGHPTPV